MLFSLIPRRHLAALIFLLAVSAMVMVRQHALSRAEMASREMRQQLAGVRERIAEAESALSLERQGAQQQKGERDRLLASVRAAEQELDKLDPDSRWATPPANQPEWNDASPYVWVRKEMMPRLPVKPFNERGEITADVARVLALDERSRQAVNTSLREIAAEYHGLEFEHAERIEDPLPGIAQDGPSITVRVTPLPEEGSRLKAAFEDTLTASLGRQKADLLRQAAEGWLEIQFSQAGAEPRTISVVRHPNGTYNVSVRSGYSWFSTGGIRDFDAYVPKHLLPLFSDLTAPDTKPLPGLQNQ